MHIKSWHRSSVLMSTRDANLSPLPKEMGILMRFVASDQYSGLTKKKANPTSLYVKYVWNTIYCKLWKEGFCCNDSFIKPRPTRGLLHCICVCTCARLQNIPKQYWTDQLHIWWKLSLWPREEAIRFWKKKKERKKERKKKNRPEVKVGVGGSKIGRNDNRKYFKWL